MRLWHKYLIPFLPRQQLLGQWRECCLIAKNIAEKGTPNHLLVNKIMDYQLGHFWKYGVLVSLAMENQCFYNLREKYDCGGISEDEWKKVYERYRYLSMKQESEK